MKNILYLHIGSNEGNRHDFLAFARSEISQLIGEIVRCSGIYETKAWGVEHQPDFLNQALKIYTELTPGKILEIIHKIENRSGRKRTMRWSSRTLDIDILFFNDSIIESNDLTIPHKMLHERNFALVPMAEIAGSLMHPVKEKTIDQLLEECRDKLEVTKVESRKSEGECNTIS
ncbi:MAG: 2-amino-4-hydroxy-6-hydroxymethyldihydropteridine diphosphokinase [Bacteroidota bacterium]